MSYAKTYRVIGNAIIGNAIKARSHGRWWGERWWMRWATMVPWQVAVDREAPPDHALQYQQRTRSAVPTLSRTSA